MQRGSTVVINESGVETSSFTPSEPFDIGAYRWWIRPFHTNGKAGTWSELGSFYAGGRPTILAPDGTSTILLGYSQDGAHIEIRSEDSTPRVLLGFGKVYGADESAYLWLLDREGDILFRRPLPKNRVR